MGVGAQDDFEYAQDFLGTTGIGPDSPVTMLWEGQGFAWQLNGVMANSTLQLFSHDLSEKSAQIWFNDDGREAVLDVAGQTPWAPSAVSS